MVVLYLSADADKAVKQFKYNGKVPKKYIDQVEIYTLEGFEIAFNDDERISDLGWIKFMDADEALDYYK